jgi:hypothetical protein
MSLIYLSEIFVSISPSVKNGATYCKQAFEDIGWTMLSGPFFKDSENLVRPIGSIEVLELAEEPMWARWTRQDADGRRMGHPGANAIETISH